MTALLLPVLNKRQLYRFKTKITDSSDKRRVVEKTYIRMVTLTFYGKRKELLVFTAFTSKIEISLNQKIQNDRLVKEAAYAFGSIELGVNDQGEIVKIYNLQKMERQWERTKSELRRDYTGIEFEDFINHISDVLKNEQQVISFLKGKNMFDLYFHGLFGKYDLKEVPKTRITTIPELDDIELTEEIRADNKDSKIMITGQRSNDEHKKIVSKNNEVIKYTGELSYNEGNQLLEGNLETESENINIKYNVVWVG